jgi:hypothetical protein
MCRKEKAGAPGNAQAWSQYSARWSEIATANAENICVIAANVLLYAGNSAKFDGTPKNDQDSRAIDEIGD